MQVVAARTGARAHGIGDPDIVRTDGMDVVVGGIRNADAEFHRFGSLGGGGERKSGKQHDNAHGVSPV